MRARESDGHLDNECGASGLGSGEFKTAALQECASILRGHKDEHGIRIQRISHILMAM